MCPIFWLFRGLSEWLIIVTCLRWLMGAAQFGCPSVLRARESRSRLLSHQRACSARGRGWRDLVQSGKGAQLVVGACVQYFQRAAQGSGFCLAWSRELTEGWHTSDAWEYWEQGEEGSLLLQHERACSTTDRYQTVQILQGPEKQMDKLL